MNESMYLSTYTTMSTTQQIKNEFFDPNRFYVLESSLFAKENVRILKVEEHFYFSFTT